jgi:hypothetical protein
VTVFGGNKTMVADVNDVETRINTIEAAWTTYAPVFSTPGGSPSIGSGGGAALTGRYKKIGRLCTVSGYLKFGTSGASAGTGEFRISLPFDAATVTDQAWVGAIYVNDTSAGASGHFHGATVVLSAGTYAVFYAGNAGAQVSGAAALSWAGGDSFRWEITYETAS